MSDRRLSLVPGEATLADLRPVFSGPVTVELVGPWRERVEAGWAVIERAVAAGKPVYAVNTGFGKLADRSIPGDQLEELQRRVIVSHITGVGDDLPDGVVRCIMVLKLLCLGQGHSGVRPLVLDHLLRFLEADALPRVAAQGSVGASGDLAPLSQLTGTLMGIGEIRYDGRVRPAGEVLSALGLEPLVLAPKEGVALINGTQASAALALAGAFAAESVFLTALAAGALSLEGTCGTDGPFDPRIQEIRGQVGQVRVAAVLASLAADSPIRAVDGPRRLQDPYSFRCQPQVMGAVLDLLGFAGTLLGREINAVSDNPLVFPADGVILSGGNFHAEPVAFASDMIAIALCEIGGLSERRTAMMMDTTISGLPPFLVGQAGLNSGLMLAQVTAAALVAENRMLSHPASVDSVPTAANQEDHVSMAMHGGRRLGPMAANAAHVVAIELVSGAQATDLQVPPEPSPGTQPVYDLVRTTSAFLSEDRVLAGELAELGRQVLAGAFDHTVPLSVFD
ncbi:MAG TPA: histidine ammonia-lyase [Acidimicrobiales bacterium]|nr:histidine ammonia-lyase [Acidimicrobiales bacterium]